MKINFEPIHNHPNGTEAEVRMARAKVFGGWIVKHCMRIKNEWQESITFVPDPKHEWVVEL